MDEVSCFVSGWVFRLSSSLSCTHITVIDHMIEPGTESRRWSLWRNICTCTHLLLRYVMCKSLKTSSLELDFNIDARSCTSSLSRWLFTPWAEEDGGALVALDVGCFCGWSEECVLFAHDQLGGRPSSSLPVEEMDGQVQVAGAVTMGRHIRE